MIFVVFSLFCGFGLVIWLSYRRVRRGEAFEPEGKLRWDAVPRQSGPVLDAGDMSEGA